MKRPLHIWVLFAGCILVGTMAMGWLGTTIIRLDREQRAYQEVAAGGPCQDFVAILPSEARFVGFRLEAVDADSQGDCFGTEVCSIGEARWVELPQIERTATLTVIHASFLNESKGRERRGRFIVLFVPPAGWQAP